MFHLLVKWTSLPASDDSKDGRVRFRQMPNTARTFVDFPLGLRLHVRGNILLKLSLSCQCSI